MAIVKAAAGVISLFGLIFISPIIFFFLTLSLSKVLAHFENRISELGGRSDRSHRFSHHATCRDISSPLHKINIGIVSQQAAVGGIDE